jgi:hypothetical protein
MALNYLQRQELVNRIAQLDAILAAGAERVPTDLGPVQYNLVEAGKERARLLDQLARNDRAAYRTRFIAVYPTRS